MPLSLTLASLWVLAAALAALLPMRLQYLPGVLLLLLAVPLMVMIGREVGWPWAAALFFAVLSMFRRPLAGLLRHVTRRFGKGAA
jgi:hypothetical protein